MLERLAPHNLEGRTSARNLGWVLARTLMALIRAALTLNNDAILKVSLMFLSCIDPASKFVPSLCVFNQGLFRLQAKSASKGNDYAKLNDCPKFYWRLLAMTIGNLTDRHLSLSFKLFNTHNQLRICAMLSSISPKERLTTFGHWNVGYVSSVLIALNGTPDTVYAVRCSITILPSMSIGRYRQIKGKKPFITSDLFAHASVLIAISLLEHCVTYFLNYGGLLSECDAYAGIIQHGHSFVMLYAICAFLHLGDCLLSRGFKTSVSSIINLAIGFVATCFDITLVQMPEVDQKNLTKLDRLLRTARRINPGTSALRGPFGPVDGIIRARRRSQI
ncbi:hypothetical protein GYMLUDRAFT_252531 [Collybiopsis luxurians FD-317 M1]|uniref:Unplaced genomic scaffold GYMLUscaffold_131, whole genome shotgun sequence n=1 Tax=Collybiopsis luxurians FD-317 M1 TaxID=944289 RepID=A0A0D0BN45_9AGAR|nr:hypothetical protein GYMLUDRAFT_252531 [Collybiopsis luxurians FD-317 M1]